MRCVKRHVPSAEQAPATWRRTMRMDIPVAAVATNGPDLEIKTPRLSGVFIWVSFNFMPPFGMPTDARRKNFEKRFSCKDWDYELVSILIPTGQ